MKIFKATQICFLLAMFGGGAMVGQQPPAVWSTTLGKTMLLWPGGAPGAVGEADDDKPTLTVYLPAEGANTTKTGVVVAPGGSYTHLSMAKEGEDIALWLNAHGVAAFVLKYRLGPKYHTPIELGDAQRAIRTVRANASEYGLATDHIGMWGFSAGGHLTAWAGTKYDAGNATATDAIDRQGSRPDFLVLAYPVITLQAPLAHAGSRQFLLGENPDEAAIKAHSVELNVTKDTPPTFIFFDDRRQDGAGAEQRDVLFGTGECGSACGAAYIPAWSAWSGAGGKESGVERVAGSAGEVDAGAGVYGGRGALAGGRRLL